MRKNIRETKFTHEGGRAFPHLSPEQQLRRCLGASLCGIVIPLRINPMEGAMNTPSSLRWRFGPDWPGRRCHARTRRGTACQKPALKGNARRQLHGARGGAPSGPANGRYRHGRFTKQAIAARKSRAALSPVTILNGLWGAPSYVIAASATTPTRSPSRSNTAERSALALGSARKHPKQHRPRCQQPHLWPRLLVRSQLLHRDTRLPPHRQQSR